MMKNVLLILLVCACTLTARSQTWTQYFEGPVTAYTIPVYIDTADTAHVNTWQIGPPQKTIFNSAATSPNVIVTDTLNTYPIGDTSVFTIGFKPSLWASWGVLAIRWAQKLDMDHAHDWGVVEYSIDSGNTWENIFANPFVYNLYGFQTANVDTIDTGFCAFTGTDTTWRDIWLCFGLSSVSDIDTMLLRFTIMTDTVDSMKEGWMIDNFMAHITYAHTVAKDPFHNTEIRVYPNLSAGIVNIEAPAVKQFHITEYLGVINMAGKVVKEYRNIPTKYYIDLSDQPPGLYYLKVRTNLYSGTYPVMIRR